MTSIFINGAGTNVALDHHLDFVTEIFCANKTTDKSYNIQTAVADSRLLQRDAERDCRHPSVQWAEEVLLAFLQACR